MKIAKYTETKNIGKSQKLSTKHVSQLNVKTNSLLTFKYYSYEKNSFIIIRSKYYL